MTGLRPSALIFISAAASVHPAARYPVPCLRPRAAADARRPGYIREWRISRRERPAPRRGGPVIAGSWNVLESLARTSQSRSSDRPNRRARWLSRDPSILLSRRSSWPRPRNPRNRGLFRLSRPQPDIPQPSNQMSRNAGVFSERRNRDTGERRIYFVAEITSGRPKGRVMYQKLRSTVSIGRPKICTSSYWCHQVFVKFRPRAAIGLRNRRSLSVILGIDG